MIRPIQSINRDRVRVGILFLAALLSQCTVTTNSHAAAAGEKPNLVIFISDDHGFLDTSLGGATQFRTPNLQRIARAGMTFTYAFAASPSCAPSRAVVLTGLMPMRNGAMLNHQMPHAEVKKLPAYLKELGYEVVAFGKVAHYKQGQNYGFDRASHDGFHDDECVAAAIDFLKQRAARSPLCLLVGTNWPHVPWPELDAAINIESFQPPPQHVDTPETRHWRARYAAAVTRFDNDLGQLYDAAFEHLGSNTLFLQLSDHGAQWPFGKWNLYDEGTRVPFVAVWPGFVPAESRCDAMIGLVDVLPALIEAAGGTPPTNIDGRSFKNVLTGKNAAFREAIFTTHSGDGAMNRYPMRSVRTRRWKYIRNLRPEAEHTTHIDLGKAIDGNAYWNSWVEKAKEDAQAAAVTARYRRRPAEELYDLHSDPLEQNNIAGDAARASVLNALRAQLDAWMQQQGDLGRVTENALEAP
jgi:N-sulfoglucosamine sulfohydrolase